MVQLEFELPEATYTEETVSAAYANLCGLLIEAIKELKQDVDVLKRGNRV